MAEKKGVGHAYNIDFLNVVFAASSIFLFISVLWMVWDDYDREWKNYQRRFVSLEMEVTRAELDQASRDVDRERLTDLEARRAAAMEAVEANRDRIRELETQIDQYNVRLYRVSQDLQFARATYDVDRYDYEVLQDRNDPRAAQRGEAVATLFQRVTELALQEERVTAERDALRDELAALTRARDEVEEETQELTAEERRLQARLAAIAPGVVQNYLLNAPLLDFMAPTLRVQQVITPNIVDDVNFMRVPKMDRCMTCHLAIDREGYEAYPQPFRTHPNLDVYLGSTSPHPLEEIGCTVCHEGMGQSVSFRDVAHTPATVEQQAAWEQQYRWEAPHYWDFPMLPTDMTEASCAKCHKQETFIPQADALNVAYGLYERAGCSACHATSGFENLRKPGPSLRRIEAKLTPDWVENWIRDPRAMKPSTWMPRTWYNSNASSPEDLRRAEAEIDATVAYLFQHSESYEPASAAPPPGNPERGRGLVESSGCLACHIMEDEGRLDAGPRRTFGQPLQGIGDKTSYEWLFDWVRDPAHYSPGTYMPDMRLTDAEAADVAAFLASLAGPPGRDAEAAYDPAFADEVLLEHLRGVMPFDEAMALVESMDPDERRIELGRRAITRYGCFSCHDIEGFEDVQPIGVELSEQGSKLLSQLDFAFVDIPHTKISWFEHKLLDPRIFDRGRVLTPTEKLRMPDYDMSEAEARLLVTALMSFQREVQPAAAMRPLSARAEALVDGRNLVRRLNCVACHEIEADGGDYVALVDDASLAPPLLTPQGAKVQPDWMYAFLQDPIPIRPWLDVRMPTFHLDDGQWNRILRYFAAITDTVGPFRRHEIRLTAEQTATGRELFELLRCQQCHVLDTIPEDQPTANLAPDLRMTPERLQPEWLLDWMRDPSSIQPGTRMPDFWTDYPDSFYPQLDRDAARQIEAIRDYLLTFRGGPSPRRPLPPGQLVAD